jgi:hypothetical protein
MTRCFACFNSNCAFKDCRCNCHDGEPSKGNRGTTKLMSKELSKMASEPHVKAGATKVASTLEVFKQVHSLVGLEIKMYAVRNSKGHWFRAKGRDGYNKKTWVAELEKAKFYTKIGQARARVTFFANNNPNNLPLLEIVEFTASVTGVIDEKERILKVGIERELKEKKEKYNRLMHDYNRCSEELEALVKTQKALARKLDAMSSEVEKDEL